MALINPHPALKAAVPQSPMVDGWMGDDWFHNGAFRQSMFDYVIEQGYDKAEGDGPAYGVGDDYAMYLKDGSAGDHARKWGLDKSPFKQLMLQNPAYTAVWSDVAVDKWMAARPLTVPTMLVVGQWDQEYPYGAPAVYKAIEPKDKNNDMVTPAHRPVAPFRRQSLRLFAGRSDLHRRHGQGIPRQVYEALLRSLPEERAQSAHPAGPDLRDRRQSLGRVGEMADGHTHAALPGRSIQRRLRGTGHGGA